MGASASLSAPALAVDPGGETETELKVRNTGGVVDQFVLDVLGEAGPFARIEPNVLNLFPGAEGTATIKFAPPKAAKTPAGTLPYGVRVWSKEDPEGSTVQEGSIDVSAFAETAAELLPRTSRGRRRARHELAVDNRGNTTMNAGVSVVDPDELVTARVTPPTIVAAPGSAVFNKIEIRPKKRFLKGAPKTIPFQVIVSADGQPPVTTDGAMVQEQVLPKWLLPLALIAIAGLLVLFVLWQTLLKPQINSAAREAALEEVEEVAASADQAQEAAEEAQDSAAAAEEAATEAGASPDGGGTPPETTLPGGLGPSSAPASAAPVDFRLTGNFAVNPGTFQTPASATREVPDGQVFEITDIAFQNPNGDTGRMQIRRNNVVIYEIGLANFRDYDHHVQTPMRFVAGDDIVVAVECVTAGTGGSCTPAASFFGFSEPAEPA
ncbi:MAG: hypothetical protein ACRD29_17795 [Acidimicrobiales bacterium]